VQPPACISVIDRMQPALAQGSESETARMVALLACAFWYFALDLGPAGVTP